MSRLGKKPVIVPSGVNVDLNGNKDIKISSVADDYDFKKITDGVSLANKRSKIDRISGNEKCDAQSRLTQKALERLSQEMGKLEETTTK